MTFRVGQMYNLALSISYTANFESGARRMAWTMRRPLLDHMPSREKSHANQCKYNRVTPGFHVTPGDRVIVFVRPGQLARWPARGQLRRSDQAEHVNGNDPDTLIFRV
jgi:hypothetical protein